MKKFITTILFLSILICLLPADLVAQNKKNGSSFLNNLYNSSQNQRRSQKSNNSTSELEKLFQDAKIKSEERKDNNNNKSEKEDKAQGDVNAQLAQDDIALVVNGEGPNKTEATRNALRSAIEQAYGTFVSSSTELINDEIIKDEIATIASGNIKSYKELSSIVLPNGNTSVSLSAIVSIGKLVQYAQTHGGSAEFAGQTFMMNMRMRELNKKNEREVLEHIIDELRIINTSFFDYSLQLGDPISLPEDEGYNLPIYVKRLVNKNYGEWKNRCIKIFNSICLTPSERYSYESNKTPMTIRRVFCPKGELYYFRNSEEYLSDFINRIANLLNEGQHFYLIEHSIKGDRCFLIKNMCINFHGSNCIFDSYKENINEWSIKRLNARYGGDSIQNILGIDISPINSFDYASEDSIIIKDVGPSYNSEGYHINVPN